MFGKQRKLDKALLKAVSEGQAETVEALLRDGACVNANNGWDCALSIAGRSPRSTVDIVRILLKNGADINGAPAGKGVYPLIRASHLSDEDRIRLLIEYGGDLNRLQSNTPLMTPFQELISWASMEMLKYAVSKGADIHKKSLGNEWTALHLAAFYGRLDVVKWLIALGALPAVSNKNDETPLDCARKRLAEAYFKAHPECGSTTSLTETVEFLENTSGRVR